MLWTGEDPLFKVHEQWKKEIRPKRDHNKPWNKDPSWTTLMEVSIRPFVFSWQYYGLLDDSHPRYFPLKVLVLLFFGWKDFRGQPQTKCKNLDSFCRKPILVNHGKSPPIYVMYLPIYQSIYPIYQCIQSYLSYLSYLLCFTQFNWILQLHLWNPFLLTIPSPPFTRHLSPPPFTATQDIFTATRAHLRGMQHFKLSYLRRIDDQHPSCLGQKNAKLLNNSCWGRIGFRVGKPLWLRENQTSWRVWSLRVWWWRDVSKEINEFECWCLIGLHSGKLT